jgi:F-type H+-transporting ATPase subunit b
MDLNLTLLGEIITFAVLVWFTMKYVWPPITKTIEARQEKIAEGLAAAERGRKELFLAQDEISKELKKAKTDATNIVEDAHKKAAKIIDQETRRAKEKGDEFLSLARADLDQECQLVKRQLEQETAVFVVSAIKKVLEQRLDPNLQNALLEKIIKEL